MMKKARWVSGLSALCVSMALVSACSGGGGGSSAAPVAGSIEGLTGLWRSDCVSASADQLKPGEPASGKTALLISEDRLTIILESYSDADCKTKFAFARGTVSYRMGAAQPDGSVEISTDGRLEAVTAYSEEAIAFARKSFIGAENVPLEVGVEAQVGDRAPIEKQVNYLKKEDGRLYMGNQHPPVGNGSPTVTWSPPHTKQGI